MSETYAPHQFTEEQQARNHAQAQAIDVVIALIEEQGVTHRQAVDIAGTVLRHLIDGPDLAAALGIGASRAPIVVESDDEWCEKSGDVDGVAALHADGQWWIAWCSEDGDWYAIRPLSEDDPPTEGSSIAPWSLDSIPYPWRFVSVDFAR